VVGAALGLTGGALSNEAPASDQLASASLDSLLADRSGTVSRGLSRAPTATDSVGGFVARGQAPVVATAPVGPPPAPLPDIPEDCEEYSGNRAIACALLPEFGFGLDQMPALDALWNHESGWNHQAYNASSGAYGIPQALPGNKMATAGSDWETNPATQIRWGLGYIKNRYGSPQGAWDFWQANGWY
jgi:hypothetical protein